MTHPDNKTILNGTDVELSCVAIEADLLSFFVNGTAANHQSVTNKGFIELGIEDIDSTTTRRNLTATVSTPHNKTEIQCGAFEIGKAEQQLFSHIGILLVQGKL